MIDKEKVLKEFDYLINEFYPACTSDSYYLSVMEAVRDLLKEQQEKIAEYQMIYGGDAVITGELIRCRDCKHYRDGYCLLNDIGTTKNWFCADGKRRVENGTSV